MTQHSTIPIVSSTVALVTFLRLHLPTHAKQLRAATSNVKSGVGPGKTSENGYYLAIDFLATSVAAYAR